jgi:hypothetical protein
MPAPNAFLAEDLSVRLALDETAWDRPPVRLRFGPAPAPDQQGGEHERERDDSDDCSAGELAECAAASRGHLVVWHKADATFLQPKAIAAFVFRCPSVAASCEAALLADLWCCCVEEALNEYTYDAECAGLYFWLSRRCRVVDSEPLPPCPSLARPRNTHGRMHGWRPTNRNWRALSRLSPASCFFGAFVQRARLLPRRQRLQRQAARAAEAGVRQDVGGDRGAGSHVRARGGAAHPRADQRGAQAEARGPGGRPGAAGATHSLLLPCRVPP